MDSSLKPSSSSGSLNSSSSHKAHHHHHGGGSHHHQSAGGSGGGGGLHHSQLVLAVSNDSKLYLMSSIEIKDALETQLEEAFNKLQYLVNPSSQTDGSSYNSLTHHAGQSKAHYDELCSALLYSILTDASTSSRCLRNLFLCNNMSGSAYPINDLMSSGLQQQGGAAAAQPNSQYAALISHLMNIITENYYRMKDQPRQQLLWLLRELVKARVNQCDKLLCQMLRNIQSGLLSDKNIWLAESLLDILSEQISNLNESSPQGAGSTSSSALWIYTFNNNELMLQAVYTYLRLISDHGNLNHLNQLRQRETEFCVQILREKWHDCCQIGRDLVRLLQNVAKIPEFEQLWRDMVHAPQTLSAQFAQAGGLLYLLRSSTKRRYIISRLTVDMERKIYFLITNVKHGQQKRYLDWFQRQYLNTPESQSLRVDLMRYILVVVHPTNEQLNAGLTPRWALCAWLLNTCTNALDSANLKLALFYDWLVYDAKRENIMFIEPAILLMYNSARVNSSNASSNASLPPNINNSSMLFDFLCRIAVNYHLPLKEHITLGIQQAFKDSVDKRVIPTMQVFFESSLPPTTPGGAGAGGKPQPVFDKDLKALIQSTFGNFFQTMNLNPLPAVKLETPVTGKVGSGITGASISLGSTSSLFKRTASNNNTNSSDSDNSSSSFVKQEALTPLESPLSTFQNKLSELSSGDLTKPTKFQGKFEKLDLAVVDNDSNSQAFSSDEEETTATNEGGTETADELRLLNMESENTNLSTKSATAATAAANTATSNLLSSQTGLIQFLFDLPAAASSLNLEQKLKTFLKKPFKIFTTNEEQAVPLSQFSQSSSSSQTSLSVSSTFENHLSLVVSHDLRTRLVELNEKLNSQQPEASEGARCLVTFREVLDLVTATENDQALSDIAACLCVVFRSEFTNNLLKVNCHSPGFEESQADMFHRFDLYSLAKNKHFLRHLYESFLYEGKPTAGRKNWLFVCLFKQIATAGHQSQRCDLLSRLFNEIYLKQNRLGYYLIFYAAAVCLLTCRFGDMTTSEQPFAELVKKCKVHTLDLTGPLIGQVMEKSKAIGQVLAFYRTFVREQVKNTATTTTTIHGKMSQISTYDSDLSDASMSEDDQDSSDQSSTNDHDDDGSEVSDDEDKKGAAGNRSKHDENYSDEDDDDQDQDGQGDDSLDSVSDSDDDSDDSDQVDDDDDRTLESDEQAGKVLMQDLRLCQQDDPYLFAFLLPYVTSRAFQRHLGLGAHLVNNSELSYLIVSSVDAKMLREITALITNKNLFLYQSLKAFGKKAAVSSRPNQKRKDKKIMTSKASAKRSEKSLESPSVDSGKKRKRAANDVKNKQIKKLKTTSPAASKSSSASKGRRKGSKQQQQAKSAAGSGKVSLRPDESFGKLLSASLEWESIEQTYFWELIRAHESLTKLTCWSRKVSDSEANKSTGRSTRSVAQAQSKSDSASSEPSPAKITLAATNSQVYAKLFAKLSPTKHSEALLGLTAILKANKPNIYLLNGVLKRPLVDFNLVKSLLNHWLEAESEDGRPTSVVHQTDLRYLFTLLLVKSTLLYARLSSTRQKSQPILAKASSLSISINKKEDSASDELKSSFVADELADREVVALKHIFDVLSRLVQLRKFRTKRFFLSYKLLFALKSALAKSSGDEAKPELARRSSALQDQEAEWEDVDEEFEYDDKARNIFDSDDEPTYSQQQHSFSHKSSLALKPARYGKLKEFVLKELERFNKSPKDDSDDEENVYLQRSKHFDGYRLDDECEAFLMQAAEEEEAKNEELTSKSIKAKSK